MRREPPFTEMMRLLERPLVATLATYRADGRVLMTPVWHEWLDGGFNLVVERGDVKERNMRRDPRAGLAVYESEPPYAGLELHATPTLQDEGASEVDRRLAIRYLGERAGNVYADRIEGDTVLVRLEPGVMRTWDYADEF